MTNIDILRKALLKDLDSGAEDELLEYREGSALAETASQLGLRATGWGMRGDGFSVAQLVVDIGPARVVIDAQPDQDIFIEEPRHRSVHIASSTQRAIIEHDRASYLEAVYPDHWEDIQGALAILGVRIEPKIRDYGDAGVIDIGRNILRAA